MVFIRGRRLFQFSFPNAAFIGGQRLEEDRNTVDKKGCGWQL